MQRAIVSASFRQGMTMLNSTESATAEFYSIVPAFGERGFCAEKMARQFFSMCNRHHVSGPIETSSTMGIVNTILA
jgi:hypothetical protein